MPGVVLTDYINCKVYWIGRKNGMEEEIVKSKGIDFLPIDTAPFAHKSLIIRLKGFMKIIKGIFTSFRYIDRYKPITIVSMGGYVGVPMIIGGWIKRVPVYLMEQDAVAGITTKIFSSIAKKVFVTDEKLLYLNNSVLVPHIIDKRIIDIREEDGKEKHILVFGGSLGSASINSIMPEVINRMKDFYFTWVTGKRDYDKYKDLKFDNAQITPFSNEMWKLYKKAQLVISRSGAITVSELLNAARPCILVPYPHAANREQYFNAKKIEDVGGGIIVEDKDLSVDLICRMINEIYEKGKIKEMRNNLLKTAPENGAEIIVREMEIV